uniref:Uncharacterized protein n=1 Tax=Rousettus aegyptiacus TaxID=9407 RepID=A0A7J8DII5_ROUAE|nr:hypothetical protein HJG63_008696 [Rousettus aegyptiacus]
MSCSPTWLGPLPPALARTLKAAKLGTGPSGGKPGWKRVVHPAGGSPSSVTGTPEDRENGHRQGAGRGRADMDVVTVREERARVASARGPGGAPAGCTPFLPSARGQRGRSQGPAAGPADSVQHAEATRGHVPAPGHGPWGHPRLAGTHLPRGGRTWLHGVAPVSQGMHLLRGGLTCLTGDAPALWGTHLASRGTHLPRGGRTWLHRGLTWLHRGLTCLTRDSPASRGTRLPCGGRTWLHGGCTCLAGDAPGFTGDSPASCGTHRGRACLVGDAPGFTGDAPGFMGAHLPRGGRTRLRSWTRRRRAPSPRRGAADSARSWRPPAAASFSPKPPRPSRRVRVPSARAHAAPTHAAAPPRGPLAALRSIPVARTTRRPHALSGPLDPSGFSV